MRVDLGAFEDKYRSDADPWRFSTSPYEQRKYDVTVASLSTRRYGRCFEPGCAIGALTERLVDVCDQVVAMDAAPTAVTTARGRLVGAGNATVDVGTIPEDWPTGSFDLVVMSEIGYYWDEASWAEIVHLARASLTGGGEIVGVHWLGHSEDHVLNGTAVHRVMRECLGDPVVRHVEPMFVLDVWTFDE